MRTITRFALALTAALTLATTVAACGSDDDDGASCDKVVEHTLTLIPDEYKDQLGDKKEMIAKCEEQPESARKCALGAKSMEDLMKCSAEAKAEN